MLGTGGRVRHGSPVAGWARRVLLLLADAGEGPAVVVHRGRREAAAERRYRRVVLRGGGRVRGHDCAVGAHHEHRTATAAVRATRCGEGIHEHCPEGNTGGGQGQGQAWSGVRECGQLKKVEREDKQEEKSRRRVLCGGDGGEGRSGRDGRHSHRHTHTHSRAVNHKQKKPMSDAEGSGDASCRSCPVLSSASRGWHGAECAYVFVCLCVCVVEHRLDQHSQTDGHKEGESGEYYTARIHETGGGGGAEERTTQSQLMCFGYGSRTRV